MKKGLYIRRTEYPQPRNLIVIAINVILNYVYTCLHVASSYMWVDKIEIQ